MNVHGEDRRQLSDVASVLSLHAFEESNNNSKTKHRPKKNQAEKSSMFIRKTDTRGLP